MMRMAIAERLKPFSHLPGISAILPASSVKAQIFPCLIRLYEMRQAFPQLLIELRIGLQGPVEQFTVSQDLEKGRLEVFGRSARGWVRYFLLGSPAGGVRLVLEKAPEGGLPVSVGDIHRVLQAKEAMDLRAGYEFVSGQFPVCDRLSLGNSKVQEGERISRHLDLAEIFPIWHRLGQWVPSIGVGECMEGTLALLENCRRSFLGAPERAISHWLHLFRAGFTGLFVPELEDSRHQGLSMPWPEEILASSPLLILTEGTRLIRQLFIQQREQEIEILPFLLPCLHCGRLLGVRLSGGVEISFEWTKKTIRRLVLRAEQAGEWALNFRTHVRSCRLRRHSSDKGERVNADFLLRVEVGVDYFFDNFG